MRSHSDEQFKYFTFVHGVQSSHTDICTRILGRIESDPNLTLKDNTIECRHIINFKNDTKMIEQPNPY